MPCAPCGFRTALGAVTVVGGATAAILAGAGWGDWPGDYWEEIERVAASVAPDGGVLVFTPDSGRSTSPSFRARSTLEIDLTTTPIIMSVVPPTAGSGTRRASLTFGASASDPPFASVAVEGGFIAYDVDWGNGAVGTEVEPYTPGSADFWRIRWDAGDVVIEVAACGEWTEKLRVATDVEPVTPCVNNEDIAPECSASPIVWSSGEVSTNWELIGDENVDFSPDGTRLNVSAATPGATTLYRSGGPTIQLASCGFEVDIKATEFNLVGGGTISTRFGLWFGDPPDAPGGGGPYSVAIAHRQSDDRFFAQFAAGSVEVDGPGPHRLRLRTNYCTQNLDAEVSSDEGETWTLVGTKALDFIGNELFEDMTQITGLSYGGSNIFSVVDGWIGQVNFIDPIPSVALGDGPAFVAGDWERISGASNVTVDGFGMPQLDWGEPELVPDVSGGERWRMTGAAEVDLSDGPFAFRFAPIDGEGISFQIGEVELYDEFNQVIAFFSYTRNLFASTDVMQVRIPNVVGATQSDLSPWQPNGAHRWLKIEYDDDWGELRLLMSADGIFFTPRAVAPYQAEWVSRVRLSFGHFIDADEITTPGLARLRELPGFVPVGPGDLVPPINRVYIGAGIAGSPSFAVGELPGFFGPPNPTPWRTTVGARTLVGTTEDPADAVTYRLGAITRIGEEPPCP